MTSDVSGGDDRVPAVNLEVVLRLAGLDRETLDLIQAAPDQRTAIEAQLQSFLDHKKPQLLTYRAIWAEMRERQKNLQASAAENVFDPCEFVTDEALQHADRALREARKRFEDFCRKANEPLEGVLTTKQYILVRNASANPGLPSPYRWLTLEEEDRRALRRLIEVHEARLRLVEKYPHLRQRLSEEQLTTQAATLLNEAQREELAWVHQHRGKATSGSSIDPAS